MELHPHLQQPGLFKFVVESGIIPIGFSPKDDQPQEDLWAVYGEISRA